MRPSRYGSRSAWIAGLALLAGAWLAAAPAAYAATASATATATVYVALTITKTADLNFGGLLPGAAAGTVTVNPDGTRTAAGVTLVGGSTFGAATFTLSGQPNATYTIALPSSITITADGSTMTVDTFTSNPSGTGQLDTGGSATLRVGATLNVGANQAPGTYAGTFDVTVDYQ